MRHTRLTCIFAPLSGGARRSGRCDEATTAVGGIEDDGDGEDPNDSELKGDSEGNTIDSSSRDTVIRSFAHISTAAMDKHYTESSVSTLALTGSSECGVTSSGKARYR
ncbi:unnamed protein product [Heligmosomoides polygyrus]|uniref:Secreted protein n=1 Tax=Heligmosomoides polygyrus TaxID=6339 RepID=A0A183GAT5_HELPZ|nr:unnamed protein product [Heligmosomoides polygyrus]